MSNPPKPFFDHPGAHYLIEAASCESQAAQEKCRPFMLLRPRIYLDGNQWCVLYGENIQEGVCAFGDTPDDASRKFDLVWSGGKP